MTPRDRRRFEHYCIVRGISMSEVLREQILNILEGSAAIGLDNLLAAESNNSLIREEVFR